MKRYLLLTIMTICLGLSSSILADEQNDLYLNSEFKRLLQDKSTYSIAILPIQNATAIDGLPYYFRARLAEQLHAKGYMVIDFKAIDDFLVDAGVQTTDQIGLVNYFELAQATSADAIMSGIIETGTLQNALVFSGYAFTGSLKLEDRYQTMLWYDLTQRVAKRRIAIDPINILFNTASDTNDQKPIDAIKAVADKLMAQMPQGPTMVIKDDLLDQAIEIREVP